MQTVFWGPPSWKFIHSVANNYANRDFPMDPEVKQHYKNFFYGLRYILPCRYCRKSYKEFIQKLPIDEFLNYPNGPLYWTYLIHNMVNNKLRKQGEYNKQDPAFADVCRYYKQFNAKSCVKDTEIETCKPNKKCAKPYSGVKYFEII